MAQITITEILGTDNIASSRVVINNNFQTLENAINTLENYLNTTPPGASLTIGNINIPLNSNQVNTVLFNNEGSAQIDGNLLVNLDFVLNGNGLFNQNLTIANKLTLTGAGNFPILTIGDVSNNPIKFILRNIEYIDESFETETAINVETETSSGTGIYEITSVLGKRVIKLSYPSLTNALSDSANIIKLPAGVPGQRIHFEIEEFAGTGLYNVYFANNNFNGKYDDLGSITPHNTNASQVDCAIGFDGTSISQANQIKRQFVELVYKSTGWEVVNAHKSILGL